MQRLAALLALFLLTSGARADGTTVAEVARMETQGQSVLWGVGLVTGLPGTGDSGKDLAMTRMLAESLRHAGVPVADLSDLRSTKSVALVKVFCTVPESGARPNDQFDVRVTAELSAKSLRGGTLFLTALKGPVPGAGVYAIAQGDLVLDDPTVPTAAKVRGGARIMRAINTSLPPGDSFNLILRPPFAGYASATGVATAITDQVYGRSGAELAVLPPIATVIDDRTIRIDIPEGERGARAAFVGDVLSAPINATLLKLPAQVVVNPRSGAIIVTGDVEISPVAITHKDLTITTTIPPPVASPANPLVDTTRWTRSGTGISATENAKLTDLLAAFKQLNLPAGEQIVILQMLDKAGQLQGRLILDE